jgi:glycosyltransferase involved in cell wall biosynthesis
MSFRIDKSYALVFERATVLLPVIDEAESLAKTVAILEQECGPDIQEYLFLVCDRTRQNSINICNGFAANNSSRFRLICQNLPFLGGAVRDGFAAATGSHVIMMASDLETDPHDVKEMIYLAKKNRRRLSQPPGGYLVFSLRDIAA